MLINEKARRDYITKNRSSKISGHCTMVTEHWSCTFSVKKWYRNFFEINNYRFASIPLPTLFLFGSISRTKFNRSFGRVKLNTDPGQCWVNLSAVQDSTAFRLEQWRRFLKYCWSKKAKRDNICALTWAQYIHKFKTKKNQMCFWKITRKTSNIFF